ncbi:hypothetical protein D7V64_03390 [Acinetobacter cumulans]|uniref:Uncharacterized protein n=1 Tax=Acinetobacter cumulans TaxID=2136182 RepID=A0A3A8G6D0_9GAMM|nr:hypothetical protein D7V64_03390 [Acinetobacter cumulans]
MMIIIADISWGLNMSIDHNTVMFWSLNLDIATVILQKISCWSNFGMFFASLFYDSFKSNDSLKCS